MRSASCRWCPISSATRHMPGLFLPLNKLELYGHLKLFVSFRKMAIIGSSDDGFLVDHKKSISDSVSEQSLACKDYLFALFEPYFRSSDETGRGTRKRKVRSLICGKHTLILNN